MRSGPFRWLFLLTIAAVVSQLVVALTLADDTPPSLAPGKAAIKKSPLAFTPEREAAAMTFVRQHHPELADLLIRLKDTNQREYERAIKDLFRASERLAMIQERNVPQYELELEMWKLESRIQLLAARVKMMPKDKQARTDLQKLLADQIDLKKAILDDERRRLIERLERLDTQVEDLTIHRDELVKEQYDRLVSPMPPPVKKETLPAATGASTKAAP